jgi:hypothetical protein
MKTETRGRGRPMSGVVKVGYYRRVRPEDVGRLDGVLGCARPEIVIAGYDAKTGSVEFPKPEAGPDGDKVMMELRENNRRLFEDVGRRVGEVEALRGRLKACSEMGMDEKGRKWMEAYFRLRDSRGGSADGIDQT